MRDDLIEGIRRLERQAKYLRGGNRPVSSRGRGPAALQDFVPWLSRKLASGTPEHRSPTHLRPLTDVLERVVTEQIELCFSVPPRHGKTTTILYWIAWILSRDPTKRILYLSHSQAFAEKQAQKAKRLAIRAGLSLGDKDTLAEWSTAEGGCVRATSIDSPPTGEGFDIVIVDDPHANRAEAESKKTRDRVLEAFLDDVYLRQEPGIVGTSFLVVHTRWHEDDLIGSLTRPPTEDASIEPFALVNLPAIDDDGRALAPDLWPVAKLRKFEQRLGPYGWWSLFMGAPRPRGGRLFANPTLCESAEVPGTGVDAIGVDLAHTSNTRSDWQAGVVLRRVDRPNAEPVYYVVDVVHQQGQLTDRTDASGAVTEPGFARALYGLQQSHRSARAGQYTGTNESPVLSLLANLRSTPVFVEAIPAIKDKWHRAQGLAAAWRDGRVIIPRQASWASDLVGELVAFSGGRGDRDDLVDAMAVAFDMLSAGAGVTVSAPEGGAERVAPDLRRSRWT